MGYEIWQTQLDTNLDVGQHLTVIQVPPASVNKLIFRMVSPGIAVWHPPWLGVGRFYLWTHCTNADLDRFTAGRNAGLPAGSTQRALVSSLEKVTEIVLDAVERVPVQGRCIF